MRTPTPGVLLALLAAAAVAPPAAAQTWTWKDQTTGNWSDPNRWTPAGPPAGGSATVLTFPSGGDAGYTATNDIGTGTFTLNALSVTNTGTTTIAAAAAGNTLTFGGSNAALTVDAAAGQGPVDAGALRSLRNELLKRVGELAAGWNAGAAKLGVKLPAWVTRHGPRRSAVKVSTA